MPVVQSERPVLRFSRDGETLTLGTDPEAEILHLHGSTGLGLPPASFALTDRVSGDGSILRGVRYGAREIFLPVMLHTDSYRKTNNLRQELYQLLAPHKGDITVELFDPVKNASRYITGRLKDGLEGEFASDFHGSYQTLGLTFVCPDPWWVGSELTRTFAVKANTKPFVSNTHPFFPVVLAGSAVQGTFQLLIGGDTQVAPKIRITGPGDDPEVRLNGSTFRVNHSLRPGETVVINAKTGTLSPDLWDKVPLSSSIPTLNPGVNLGSVSMTGATEATRIEITYRERFLSGV